MGILNQLFLAFIQVGMFSVGGGYAAIPLIQNQIVDIHGLMTLAEFTDLITIAEMTPGPISINSATFVGMRLGRVPGVLLCTLGALSLPSVSAWHWPTSITNTAASAEYRPYCPPCGPRWWLSSPLPGCPSCCWPVPVRSGRGGPHQFPLD